MEKEVLEALGEFSSPYATFLSESTLSRVDDYIDTGSMVLNALISGSLYGGIPVGRVTVLAGESKVGKTLFLLKIMANAQKKGLIPVIFDTENAIDAEGARRLGVDPEKVKYIPVTSIEELRNEIYKFLTTVQEKGLEGKFIIGVDSLNNMFSQMEMTRMEKDSTSIDMGTKARAMGTLMTTITNMCGITRTTAICTAHIYDNPGEMYPSLEKNIPGGKKVKYLPSVTVQLARKPVKDDGGKTIKSELATGQKSYSGQIIRALTVKNRLIRQFLEGEMYLSFASGLDKRFGLLSLLVGMGVVTQSGATYALPDGSKLGYYKNWRKDNDLWEKTLLPDLESKIKDEWSYGSVEDAEESDIMEEDPEVSDEPESEQEE
jgi:RecA/RadA recombinase